MRRTIETPTGPAWVDIDPVAGARARLLLGHGAGGGVDAPDLQAVRRLVVGHGVEVVRVTQPYRVKGHRAPPTPARLDEAWLTVTEALADDQPMIFGGRSSGARVACRTASAARAVAVVALAFPVHPPGKPEKDRLAELALPQVPVLVVQGDRDPFGMPPSGRVVVVRGADHSLKRDTAAVAAAVLAFLRELGLSVS